QATVYWITTACRGIPVRSSRIARRINPALYQRPFRIELARLDQFPAAYERRRAPYECIRTRPLAWILLMAHFGHAATSDFGPLCSTKADVGRPPLNL